MNKDEQIKLFRGLKYRICEIWESIEDETNEFDYKLFSTAWEQLKVLENEILQTSSQEFVGES